MSQHLQKHIAIVTGGGSGIGFAIAKKFIAEGKTTVIIGRNKEKLDEALACLGNNCIPFQADLNDLAAIPSLIENIEMQYGLIDVLVNNAGVNMKKPVTEVSDDDFAAVLHTNLQAVFAISREVIRRLLKHNLQGSIINISSMASQYGLPSVIDYTASK